MCSNSYLDFLTFISISASHKKRERGGSHTAMWTWEWNLCADLHVANNSKTHDLIVPSDSSASLVQLCTRESDVTTILNLFLR